MLPARASLARIEKKYRETEENSVRGHAARKQEDKLGDLESEPWLAEASILIVNDEPGARTFWCANLSGHSPKFWLGANS
jgi:hypothetical protein